MSEPLHVVLGASGGAGGALVRQLVADGRRVRAVSRRQLEAPAPPGTEVVTADLATAADRGRVYRDAAVVYMAAQPPYTRWPEAFPALLDGAIAGAASSGARLVMVDNLYMYGPSDGPLTESLPLRAVGRKGATRVRMTERLLDAHARGTIEVTIGRASDFFGPGVRGSNVGERVFEAVLAGRPTPWLGSLDQPHTLSYVDDVARALILLGDRDEATGRAWHLPVLPPVTGREFLTAVWNVAGAAPRLRVDARRILSLVALFSPMVREVKETLYQFEAPFVVDDSAFRRTFGDFPLTPLPSAIEATLEWYRTG